MDIWLPVIASAILGLQLLILAWFWDQRGRMAKVEQELAVEKRTAGMEAQLAAALARIENAEKRETAHCSKTESETREIVGRIHSLETTVGNIYEVKLVRDLTKAYAQAGKGVPPAEA